MYSHKLYPLTKIMYSKVKFKWTKTKQEYFREIKRIVAHGTLSDYLDFNGDFKINTDDRDFQLGEIIIQNGKTIDFYSKN